MSNKRRIDENSINHYCINQLNKKIKHKKIVYEEKKTSEVCIDIVKLGNLVLILVFYNFNQCNKV